MIKRLHKTISIPGFFCLGCLILVSAGELSAAPGADDLLIACENSLENDFQGIEGDLCVWYVTPCDCDYGKAPELPRVCLPASVSKATLARAVVNGLTDQPELQTKAADYAAAMILSRIYPCTE